MYTKKVCHYCWQKYERKAMARVYFDDHNIRWYCPKCLPEVMNNVKDIPWIKKNPPEISYPFAEEGD